MGLVGRKGKLSITESATNVQEVAWQRYEDVLTADVFGAYRYLPPSLGLLPLLQHAVDETGLAFSKFLQRQGIELSTLNVVRLRFWPTFENGREPDVFVLLESTESQQSVALLVEAKLHASQHEIGEHSQVGHYLIQHLSDGYADDGLPWELPQLPRPLLFLTNHSEIPASELARARREVIGELPDLQPQDVGLFWVNWATAGLEAKRLWQDNRDEVDSAPWLRHLLDLYEEIRDRDLLPRAPFAGISSPPYSYLPPLYVRSYSTPLPATTAPIQIARRQYCCPPAAALSAARFHYRRTYISSHHELSHFPRIYSRTEGERK